MSNNYTVYMHVFPNNKRYIGITRQKPEQRWQNGNGYKNIHQKLIYRAINKYGWDNIQHIILHTDLSEEAAKDLERYYITKVFKSNDKYFGYNQTDGGDGVLGYKHTDQTKAKISKKSKEMWDDESFKAKMSVAHSGELNGNYGKPISSEQKKILSDYAKSRVGDKNAFWGKHHSCETKKKISEKKKNQNCGAKNINSKPVRCIETDVVFESAGLAAKWVGASASTITNACRKGSDFSSYGYHWEYV